MRRLLAVITLAVGLVGGARAEPHDDALGAYEAGEYEAALAVWRALAEQGHARAQSSLAFLYQNGDGVPQDYAAAAIWYHRAAVQGDALAQWNLGFMHRHGQGVAVDLVRAYAWFSRAALALDAALAVVAIGDRDEVAAQLTPGQLDEARRLPTIVDQARRDRHAP